MNMNRPFQRFWTKTCKPMTGVTTSFDETEATHWAKIAKMATVEPLFAPLPLKIVIFIDDVDVYRWNGSTALLNLKRTMAETWRLWATLALTWLAAGSTSGRSLGHGVTSHSERTSLMLPEICSRNPFGTRRFSLQQVCNATRLN